MKALKIIAKVLIGIILLPFFIVGGFIVGVIDVYSVYSALWGIDK